MLVYGRQMLNEVSVEGFKAIRQTSIPLGRFNLLIGRNGVGKSSVIEALQWLQEALLDGLGDATIQRYRTFDELRNRRCTRTGIELRFTRNERVPAHYSVKVRPGAGLAKTRPIVDLERCVVGRTNAARTVLWSRGNSAEKRGPPYRWLRNRAERAFVVKSGDELALASAIDRVPVAGDLASFIESAVFLRLSPTALATTTAPLGRARGPALKEDGRDLPLLIERLPVSSKKALAARVAKIFPSVQGVGVAKLGDARHVVIEERMISRGGKKVFAIPSWLLSEGMRRIVAIFALLELQPRPPLIAIEEIENGLDPWTLEHVLDALRLASDDGTQVLLTTHSPFLLDHVNSSEVVHVHREAGESTYTPVDDLPAIAKYKGVLAPGAMYLSRLFGSESKPTDASEDE